MRLATLLFNDEPRVATVVDDRWFDLSQIAPDMLTFINGGEAALQAAQRIVEQGMSRPLDEATFLSPISRPPKNVIALGLNYREHALESQRAQGLPFPEYPVFFTKAATSILGHEGEIVWKDTVTQQVDWEVELALIIGRGGRDIPRENAFSVIYGYTACNDVSARDLQFRHGQWYRGKSLDTFCPLGPWIVTADEIPIPGGLEVITRVNGIEKQHSNTAELIFDIPTIIETISAGATLETGDVIITGTPSGVGFARTPPEFLGDGDIVEVEVEQIGVLRNRCRIIRTV
ncbi:MAG: fumarylacetoacetate hydrolase family protein [Chloroflexota bacterium]